MLSEEENNENEEIMVGVGVGRESYLLVKATC